MERCLVGELASVDGGVVVVGLQLHPAAVWKAKRCIIPKAKHLNLNLNLTLCHSEPSAVHVTDHNGKHKKSTTGWPVMLFDMKYQFDNDWEVSLTFVTFARLQLLPELAGLYLLQLM